MTVRSDSRTVLITGAAYGIGNALARVFAAQGYDLVLVDIEGERLDELATELSERGNVSVTTIRADLADPTAPEEIDDAVTEEGVTVDVLVNNAGIGVYGEFSEVDLDEVMDLVQINVASLTRLTGLFLPRMVARGSGKILNVASTSAFSPGPYSSTYNASKSYVVLFSEAIAEEVRDDGVTVTAFCPGHTDTNFFERMGVEESESKKEAAKSPMAVAKEGYRGLMRGDAVVFDDRKEEVKAAVAQALPRRLVRRIAVRNEQSRGRKRVDRDERPAAEAPLNPDE